MIGCGTSSTGSTLRPVRASAIWPSASPAPHLVSALSGEGSIIVAEIETRLRAG